LLQPARSKQLTTLSQHRDLPAANHHWPQFGKRYAVELCAMGLRDQAGSIVDLTGVALKF